MSAHGEVKPTVAMCFGILFVLMALLLLTYYVGMYVDAGEGNFLIAFAIAMTKATIIILFFMHIYYTQPLIRIVASSGFFFLMILIGLTLCDFKTRNYLEPGRITVEHKAPDAAADAALERNVDAVPAQ